MSGIKIITYAESREAFFVKKLKQAEKALDNLVKYGTDHVACAEKGEIVSFYQDALSALKEKQEQAAVECVEDMALQFAYKTMWRGRAHLSTGGLSALESAFSLLEWPDPKPTPESECQHKGCHEHATCGMSTPDGYKCLCGKHAREYRGAEQRGEDEGDGV